jgi:DNA-binding LytR/AlgR family response regulator
MHEPLQALVLEDEWPARNYLVQLLERSGLAHVVAAAPSTALASEALSASPTAVDVAFVDVCLAGAQESEHAGLAWIESVLESTRKNLRTAPSFVLTSAKEVHALRAFELGAVDYLLKPFTESRVRATIERISASHPRQRPEPRADVRIAARDGKLIAFLRKEETFAFEAEGRLCHVHSARGKLSVDLSLTSLESVLGPSFLRVHRSWLVSLEHILSMERDGRDATLYVGPSDPPLRVNVARDRVAAVRERLLSRAIGLRREVESPSD